MRTETPPVYTEIAAIHERIAAGGPPPAHTAACATCGHDLGPVDTPQQATAIVLDCGGRVDPDGSLVCPECVEDVEDEHLEDTMTNTVELPIGTTTDGTLVSWALDSHGLIYGHTGTGKTRTLEGYTPEGHSAGQGVYGRAGETVPVTVHPPALP
ncbi:hypothetical protein ACQEU5_25275 [Marinactinospora thermotolerans]|uniref:hypothetical protein n=1 Tax=Marinactinospora thermotolerans TaxID=531310 RepID=UPI003D935A20